MVAEGYLFTGLDGSDGIDCFYVHERVPGVNCVGSAAVIDATDVRKDATNLGSGAKGVPV